MKRNFLLTAIAGVVFLLAGCGKDKEPPVPVVSIGTQPTAPPSALVEGDISGSLTIAASATEGAALTYQWYSNTTAGSTGGTIISGATSATYALPTTLTAGTYHYFCEVGAKGAAAVRSAVVTVTVNAPQPPEAAIRLADPSHATQSAWADELHTGEGFTFIALADWVAEVVTVTADGGETRASDVEWVRLMSGDIEKYDGAPGTHTLVVALDPNYTGDDRTATVTLTANGESIDVEITHAGTREDGTPHYPPATFTAVSGITGVPSAATVGTPLTLTGTVAPSGATNKTIVWSVSTTDAGTTGASVSGTTFNATTPGTATVTATIAGGETETTAYTQDFDITVTTTTPPPPAFVAVTGITGVPSAATVGTPLTLTGTVAPSGATNKTITWSVSTADAGTTGASVSGTTFNATTPGTATVTATIANGETASTPFTRDFPIIVSAPDTTPPTVSSVTPNGTGAAVGGDIVITFSEAMSTAPGSVQLNALPALSGGAWSVGNTVYTIPYTALAYATEYTVNISGFKDAAGNTMADNSAYSFTTAAPTTVITITGETSFGLNFEGLFVHNWAGESISVTASATPDAELSYQWYHRPRKRHDGSANTYHPATRVEGATSATLEFSALYNTEDKIRPTLGDNVYYCEVSAVGAEPKRSKNIFVDIYPGIINGVYSETTVNVTQGAITADHFVTVNGATLYPWDSEIMGELEYYWYKIDEGEDVNSPGAQRVGTDKKFQIPTDLAAGTHYYACFVLAPVDWGYMSVTGGIPLTPTGRVTVTVAAPGTPSDNIGFPGW